MSKPEETDREIFGPGWLDEEFREVERIVSSWPPEMQEAIRGRPAVRQNRLISGDKARQSSSTDS